MGPGQSDVPALLRSVATSITDLRTVTVQHIAFSNEVTEDGPWPNITVYFHSGELAEACACGRCFERTPNTSPVSL